MSGIHGLGTQRTQGIEQGPGKGVMGVVSTCHDNKFTVREPRRKGTKVPSMKNPQNIKSHKAIAAAALVVKN